MRISWLWKSEASGAIRNASHWVPLGPRAGAPAVKWGSFECLHATGDLNVLRESKDRLRFNCGFKSTDRLNFKPGLLEQIYAVAYFVSSYPY